MRLTKLRRALCLLLALAVVLPLTAAPGRASSFLDVTDAQVARAADTLSALGVVSGTGEGEFSPDGHLTRAQLCKMAVEIMGMGEQAKAQEYRTIFTDMGKDHWARGYVNLAAITEVPEGSGTRLMLGLGDGTFGPDREITYQEAVTLALRILGYGEEANRAWPHSAVETAAQLGLDQDLGVEQPSDLITRGQTALLFYHLLTTPVKGEGKPYADTTLGKLEEGAILLACDATVNGQSGWAVVAQGDSTKSYPTAAPVDETLLGQRGWALLDEEGRFVTLLPDPSGSITAAVESKPAYYLNLKGYGRYTVPEDTPVYTGSAHDAKVTTYKEYMADIRAGTLVTLYLDEQGKVVGLYRAEASDETRFLVFGNRTATYEAFQSLTGTTRDYTIRKNGATIEMRDIRQYDVVTYDPIAKVLEVCDVRMTCVYENASPTPTAPDRITVAGGNRFDVLADAVWNFAERKLGDTFTVLFTANGKVAGLLPKGAEGNLPTAAYGVLLSEDELQLLGCNVTLKLPSGAADGLSQAYLYSACSVERGTISVERVGTTSSARFDTKGMTLSGMKVSPGALIYERTSVGLLARDVSDLPASVTAAQYHRDGSSGQVDLIIVESYSSEGLKYGRIDMLNGYQVVRTIPAVTVGIPQATWLLMEVQQVAFTRDGETEVYPVSGSYHTSGYGSVMRYGNVTSINYLRAIKDVPSTAFYTQDGATYVRTSAGVYLVDEDVQCFNEAASYRPPRTVPAWVSAMQSSNGILTGTLPDDIPEGEPWYPDEPNVEQFSSLGECRSFSDTVTVYIDDTVQRVRVVTAGE